MVPKYNQKNSTSEIEKDHPDYIRISYHDSHDEICMGGRGGGGGGNHPTGHIESLIRTFLEESRNDSSIYIYICSYIYICIIRSMTDPISSQYERDTPLDINRDSSFRYGFGNAPDFLS